MVKCSKSPQHIKNLIFAKAVITNQSTFKKQILKKHEK